LQSGEGDYWYTCGSRSILARQVPSLDVPNAGAVACCGSSSDKAGCLHDIILEIRQQASSLKHIPYTSCRRREYHGLTRLSYNSTIGGKQLQHYDLPEASRTACGLAFSSTQVIVGIVRECLQNVLFTVSFSQDIS
jgi:hypothetical protein